MNDVYYEWLYRVVLTLCCLIQVLVDSFTVGDIPFQPHLLEVDTQ